MEELEYELGKINWDILGVCETRRAGNEYKKLRSGNILFHQESPNKRIGGIGIMINKRMANRITNARVVSERVIYIVIGITNSYTLKVVQVYAPTAAHEDEEAESFYEEVSKSLEENRTSNTIIIGDFNAKVGPKRDDDEIYIGRFENDIRNPRGDMLVDFLMHNKLFNMNSFFKKKSNRRWTWISPNGQHKNEIDYVLSTNRQIVSDVSVLNQFSTGSDHRAIRCRVTINRKAERILRIKRRHQTINNQRLEQSEDAYQQNLKNYFLQSKIAESQTINGINEKLTLSIKQSLENIDAYKRTNKTERISVKAKQLLEKRRLLIKEGKRNSIEFTELNKTVRKIIKEDIRKHKTKIVEDTIEQNKGMRILRRTLSTGKKEICKLKDENGVLITDKNELLETTRMYYEKLYKSQHQNPREKEIQRKIVNVNSEDIPEITPEEIVKALKTMKCGKAPGEDNIVIEAIKHGGPQMLAELRRLFNLCLEKGEIPDRWNNALVILLYKKGDAAELDNYRPISLLSQVYKLFSKIITNRLENKFDFYQPKEQAGFRKSFSCMDHLQTIRLLIEKTTEYQIPLWLAFVDYRKAFDSVETWAILEALHNARIDYRYTNLIENLYKNATLSILLHENTNKVKVQRGVRQGDVISPKLFTLAMEDVFKQLKWDNMGLNIYGEMLNHLRFADDVVLITDNPQDLQRMLTELNDESQKIGLELNINKTKIMTNEIRNINTPIQLQNLIIEQVDKYIYLGQEIRMGKDNQKADLNRRIRLGWAAYGKLNYLMKMDIPQTLKTKVYNECILPVLLYGTETWAFNKSIVQKMRTTERAMERKMVGINLIDRKTNTWLRKVTKVDDIVERMAKQKWEWAGHVARTSDRWTKKLLNWRPWSHKRPTGRPQTRWQDDVKRVAGLNWQQLAQNRMRWKQEKEAYVTKWTEEG